MKNIFTTAKLLFFSTAILLMLALNTNAQNKKISMQGFLKDANGKAIADGDQAMTFKIYSVATGGSPLWSENQTIKVFGGVYSAYLGAVTNVGTLAWDVPYFVGVTVQGAELIPRTELTYAPYAFSVAFAPSATNAVNAQNAVIAQTVVCSGAVGDVKYSVLNPAQFATVNGSCWVPMDGRAMGGGDRLRQITGWGNVPNAGGLFFRSQEYGGSNYDSDRTTGTSIAVVQEESFKNHGHNASTANDGGGATIETSVVRFGPGFGPRNTENASSSPFTTTLSLPDHSHSVTVNATGGNETRPNNMNLFAYIRIN